MFRSIIVIIVIVMLSKHGAKIHIIFLFLHKKEKKLRANIFGGFDTFSYLCARNIIGQKVIVK